MQTIDLNVTHYSLNNRLIHLQGRVSATYNPTTNQLSILCPVVGERWHIKATPKAAMKIAKTYKTPLTIQ